MPALDFNMPPKKDKKSATSSDNSGSTGDIHIPDACESTLGESQPVSTKTTRSASLTTDSSLMDVLRNELRELKSGIQEKLDLVINNQQSLLKRMDNMESRHREMEKSVFSIHQRPWMKYSKKTTNCVLKWQRCQFNLRNPIRKLPNLKSRF